MSFENYMKGVALADAEHAAKLQQQQNAENHKLAVQQKKLELDTLKLQQALHQREIQGLTPSVPEMASPQGPSDIQSLLMQQKGIPTPPNIGPVLPPPQDITAQLSTGNVTIPGSNQQMRLSEEQRVAAAALQQKIAEAGGIAQAQEQAKAPYTFHEQTPGSQGVIGAGTPTQTIVSGPPAKLPEPSIVPEDITVNGKGPVKAILVKQGNEFKWMDATTHQPIQGTIGTYERPREGNPFAADNQLEKSYQFHVTKLTNATKPVDDAVARLNRLRDAVNQHTPQADALIAPELLTVMAGGQGSGLRMNEAEIARIVGGRSNLEALNAALNKWRIDPTKALSITEPQRQQIRALVDQVATKLQAKQDAISTAGQAMADAKSSAELKQTFAGMNRTLDSIDRGGGSPPTGQVRVQIPGHPPGVIPASALPQFLKENPGATQIQ